jgi:hypothetical protein
LITLDLLQSPAAQPREVLDRLPKHPNPAPLAWDSGGTAAAGENLACPPPHQPRSGGRRRLADARHGAAVAR